MDKHLKISLLTILLLGIACIQSFAETHFNKSSLEPRWSVTPSSSASTPYFTITYPDYNSSGDPDVMRDIHWYVGKNQGSWVEIATIPRCHDNLTFVTGSYGYFGDVKTTSSSLAGYDGGTGNVRTVSFKFYPSDKFIKEGYDCIKFTGWWDNDDDNEDRGNTKNSDITWTASVSCTKLTMPTTTITRTAPNEITIKEGYAPYVSGRTAYLSLNTTSGYSQKDVLSTTTSTAYSAKKITSYTNLDKNGLTAYYYWYSYKSIAVQNNFYDCSGTNYVTSKYFTPEQSIIFKPLPVPTTLTATTTANVKTPVTLSWSSFLQTAYETDGFWYLFRNDGANTVLLSSTISFGSTSYTDNTAATEKEYTYYLMFVPTSWTTKPTISTFKDSIYSHLLATSAKVNTARTAYTISVTAGTGGSIAVDATATVTAGTNKSLSYRYGDKVILKATPSEGYEFSKWSTNETNTSCEITVTTSLSITATFTAKTYNVNLNATNATTTGTQLISATYNQSMPKITSPTRTGYTFSGYWSSSTGGTQYYNADGSSTRNWNSTTITTLYAHWTALTYTVTLDGQSATTAGTAKVTATYGSSMPTITVPVRTGYTFGGYYTSKNGGGTQYYTSAGASTRAWNLVSNTTLYAYWKPIQSTITFNSQSADIEGTKSVSITYDKAMPSITIPVKKGYAFNGYFTGTSGSGTKYYNANGTSINSTCTLTSNITLYASWSLTKYTVTLNNMADATIEDEEYSLEYKYGESLELPKVVSKNGCDFAGWYDNENFSGDPIIGITSEDYGNKMFYAKWIPKEYSISFYVNEGVINSGIISKYTFGVGVALPTNVTKDGNTFYGWYDNEDCLGEPISQISVADFGDKKYWAKWGELAYTIILNANYGTINTGNVMAYGVSDEIILPTDVTKTGYSFKGWYDNSNLEGTAVSTIAKGSTGNKEYWAKWVIETYSITLHENEGSINSGNVEVYTYGNGANLPSDVTREGYTFGGWYENEDCSGERFVRVSETSVGNKTFWAKWTRNTYSITYNNNGGVITDSYELLYTYGEKEVILPTTAERIGYTFAGWYDNSNLLGVAQLVIPITDYGNKSYWAKWNVENYKITFVTNDGLIQRGKIDTYMYGVGALLPSDVVRDGYTFNGWYSNVECTGDAVSSVSVADYGDKTFYAKWTANEYTITLNNNGGMIQDDYVPKTYVYQKDIVELPKRVERAGYTFAGWFTNSNFIGEPQTVISTEEYGDKTFYAKWLVNTYAISLDANDGKINSGNVSFYTYGVGANLPSDVTKTGYTFAGWYDVTDSTTQVVRVAETAIDDKAFFAKWTANEYSIILVTNEGVINEGNVESYAYGEGATLPINVTKEGYTFEGWYTNSSYIGGTVLSIAQNDCGDKQFWAKWSINNYDVFVDYDMGMGTVTGEGLYEHKSMATLKAFANEGYEFLGWNDGITDNTIQFVVTKDSTLIANFKEKEKVENVGTLEIPTLKTEREAEAIDVTGLFTSTEGGDISYSATSSVPNVISATVNEGKLYLTVYEYEGEAEITVTGTLANGEKNSVTATAKVVLACNIQVAESIKNVSCYGESDGEIDLKISNAVEPYTIQWTGETFTTDTIINLVANNYTINIEDAEGCTFQKTYTVTQPEEMTMKAVIKNPTCSNADGAITIAVSGVETALYQWSNEATTQNLANLVKGEYTLIVTNAETTCQISETFPLTEPAAPIITVANVVATACNEANGAVTISANEDNLIYSWSNTKTTKNLTNVRAGDYTLNVINPETNCTASLDVTVPSIALKQPEISLVTVSEETGKNLVVWLKENTDLIDYYTIYRENDEGGVYEKVETVSYNELSVYEDLEADPNIRPWRYKISATDVCGTETEKSTPHLTMHIQKNSGADTEENEKQTNLSWNSYEGLDFSTFIVMCKHRENGKIVVDTLTTLPSTINSYTVDTVIEHVISYYVGIKLPNEINPKTQFMKAESGPFAIAISNIAEVENEDIPDAIYNLESNVVAYANDHIIYVKNSEGKEIMIYDNSGHCVFQKKDAEAENEFTIRLDGIYFVVVDNESFAVIIK